MEISEPIVVSRLIMMIEVLHKARIEQVHAATQRQHKTVVSKTTRAKNSNFKHVTAKVSLW